MVRDARQLGEEHAEILRADRHFEVEQLLDREHIAVLHAQRRAIIEPVEIRQRLLVGLVLDQLLGAAVEQADMRIEPLDDLAVELHHQPQHAVRGGMLRAEVDRVVLDLDVARRRVGGVGPAFDLVEMIGHWFCRLPLAARRIRRRGRSARSVRRRPWRGLPAHVDAASAGLGFARSCRRRSRPCSRSSWAVGAGAFAALAAASAFLISSALQRRRRALRPAGSARLLVAGQDIFGAFPRAHEVEVAEILRQLHRLIDDALGLFRIAQLDIARQREILALRMPAESRNRSGCGAGRHCR